jgi:hypothetical protein
LIESLDRFTPERLSVNLFTSLLLNGITVITGIDKQVYRQTEVNTETLQQLMFSVMLFSRQTKKVQPNHTAPLQVLVQDQTSPGTETR